MFKMALWRVSSVPPSVLAELELRSSYKESSIAGRVVGGEEVRYHSLLALAGTVSQSQTEHVKKILCTCKSLSLPYSTGRRWNQNTWEVWKWAILHVPGVFERLAYGSAQTDFLIYLQGNNLQYIFGKYSFNIQAFLLRVRREDWRDSFCPLWSYSQQLVSFSLAQRLKTACRALPEGNKICQLIVFLSWILLFSDRTMLAVSSIYA